MLKKIKSFFSKKKKEKPSEENVKTKSGKVQIGESVSLVLEKSLKNCSPPEGVSREDWGGIKEQIIWSFSALSVEKKPLNNTKRKKEEEKIKKGLILFANHVENLKI